MKKQKIFATPELSDKFTRYPSEIKINLLIIISLVLFSVVGISDSFGQTVPWSVQFGSNSFDSGRNVAVDSSGNAYVTGSTDGNLFGTIAGESDIFVVKYDTDGNEIWTKQFGSDLRDIGIGIAVDSLGNAYVTGTTKGNLFGTISGESDIFVVKYDTDGESDIFADEENSMGQIKWLEKSYLSTGTGVIRVIDSDMNFDPKAVDNFDVDVWSDSYAVGTDPTMTETGPNTGVFESTVYFTTTEESSGHRLRVVEGDTITAEYQDNTLPAPYVFGDELYLTATVQIHATSLKAQLANNISQEKITCSSSFHVLTERTNGYLVCVYPTTAIKLGWEMLNAYTNAEIIPQES